MIHVQAKPKSLDKKKMQISRSLKIFQKEDLEDSEESEDSANYEGLEAFGGPRGLTVPSQY